MADPVRAQTTEECQQLGTEVHVHGRYREDVTYFEVYNTQGKLLASCRFTKTTFIKRPNLTPTTSAAVVAGVTSGTAAALTAGADLNRDGFPDPVAVDQARSQVAVYLANSDGSLQPPVFYKVESTPTSIAAGDLNGGGVPVKQLYSINIDNSMARQIAGIAQQKYAGHVSIAVRDPDVRKMLMLYSEATGQKMPLSATTPVGGSLVEQGGRLYQQASYVNGVPYSFQSSLPVLGGLGAGNVYPNPGGPVTSGGGGVNLALNINGQPITPEFVQAQWSNAAAGSNGRLQNSAVIQQPGLVIA